MYVDIYSLGFGALMLQVPTGSFGIRNLQVLRKYRWDRVPEEAIAMACGTLGKWNPLAGDLPKLEIVWHNEETTAWRRLDPIYRSPEIQKAGHQKPLFVPNQVIIKQLFPGMIDALRPRVLGDEPLRPPPSAPRSPATEMVDARKIEATPATGAMRPIEDVALSGISDAPPPAAPEPVRLPDPVRDEMPDLSDLVSDGVATTQPAAAPATCRGTTGSGGRCQRKATTPEGFCRTHFSQASV